MVERTVRNEELSLEAIKAGDKHEIARMVEVHSPNLFRLGLKMLGSEQDAEDVLQETFLKALRSISSFEGRASLSTWLYRITMNEIFMLLRKRKREIEAAEIDVDQDDEAIQPPVEIIDWCCLPEKELLASETRTKMDQAVQKLSPALRSVFVLRDMNGLSVRDTAEALRISEGAVKTRLLRARLQLREDLSVYFGKIL